MLDQETTKLRLTPYIDKSAALGVFIYNRDSTKYFDHNGGNEGFRCQYYGSLEGGNGVVVMVNSDNFDIIPEIVNSIAKVYGFKGLYRTVTKKLVSVPDSVLETYTGKYQLEPKVTLAITRDGNHLYGQPGLNGKHELFPETQTKFFLKDAPLEVEFVKDDKGEIIKIIVYENGPHDAKKIK